MYSFESRAQADAHPLIQYGDAILDGPADITAQYNLLEIGRLIAMLGCEKTRLSVLRSIHPDLGLRHSERLKKVEERAADIWSLMEQAAVSPPSDPAEIMTLIQKDREATKESTMTDKAANAAPKTDAKEKAPAKEKVVKAPKYAGTSTIKLLSDKDGKQFGADHNPKRAGSASALRFANYSDGLTIAELLEKGDSQATVFADLDYDIKKGFIEVVTI